MKIFYGKYVVETQFIQSVCLDTWGSGSNTEFAVQVAFTSSGVAFKFNSKDEADIFMTKICEAIEEEVKDEKTYIDGFKDGTEYALRLIQTKQASSK